MAVGAGARTFVFTDIEGSTDLWERAPDDMRTALARHDELLRKAIADQGGRVFATGGDGVAAVFARAVDAVRAAVEVQSHLAAEPWPTPSPVRIRIGVHTGEAEERDGDYFGPTLNRCARLMAIAHGGQVVCSGATAALLDGAPPAPLVDLGQHRLRDLSAPLTVFQVGEGSFAPLRSLDSVPSNLPTMVTDLVGRADEIRSLVAEVRTDRLVTLTGVGGVGKTRLALAVGGAVAPDFADGCWLAELAPLADGGEVVRTVAAALGAVNLAAGDVGALVRYLAHRRLVLVLDNCEHVLDDVAALVDDVVVAAPDVHIVTTSREPLGVDGEVVRRVRSLDGSPAVELFVERARAADGEFELSTENAADVAEICRHLDGIPLAIELAAARVRAMAPAEIARRLDDRFRMLTGGRRAQERHRTLQATVGWSYDLLSEDDRRVFARLSVLPATFDLPAALAVADTDDVDAVVRLVDRSLVVHDRASGRYRLLETLRQYGADRLAEMGESEATRERYAGHYIDLIAAHGPGTADHRHDGTFAMLTSELENISATADWLVEHERWRQLRQLTLDGLLFVSQFMPTAAATWLRHAVDDPAASDAERSEAHATLALFTSSAVELEDAAHHAGESARLAAAAGIVAWPWALWARVMLGSYTGAAADERLSLAEEMLVAATERGDEFAAICALSQMAPPLAMLGRHEDSQRRTDEALERAVRLDNATALSVAFVTAASVQVFDLDDMDRLRTMFERYGDKAAGARGGINYAWLLSYRALSRAASDANEAVRDAIEAARTGDRVGSEFAAVNAVEILAVACLRAGLPDEARQLAAYLDATVDDAFYLASALELRNRRRAAFAAAGAPATESLRGRRDLFGLLAHIERSVSR